MSTGSVSAAEHQHFPKIEAVAKKAYAHWKRKSNKIEAVAKKSLSPLEESAAV